MDLRLHFEHVVGAGHFDEALSKIVENMAQKIYQRALVEIAKI